MNRIGAVDAFAFVDSLQAFAENLRERPETLPWGPGRRWNSGSGAMNATLGGWDLSAVTLLQSGQWLTPTMNPTDDQSNTDLNNLRYQGGAVARPIAPAAPATPPSRRRISITSAPSPSRPPTPTASAPAASASSGGPAKSTSTAASPNSSPWESTTSCASKRPSPTSSTAQTTHRRRPTSPTPAPSVR